MKPPLEGSVKSVKRALDLLELLAEHRRPLSFLELMKSLGIPRSSLFHLMGQLIARGYVEEVASGNRYRLGHMPGVIAGQAARRTWLTEIVAPVIRALSDQTNEFSAFYIAEGDMVRGVAVAEGTHALSYRIALDHLVPLHAFSAGKVALADRTDAAVEAYIANVERPRFTANTVIDGDQLRAVVAQVRETGVGRSRSEYALGVVGIAMAVRPAGELVGIVNVSVPEPRCSRIREAEVTQALREAVAALEARFLGS